jgi:hypothetical protein
MEKEIKKLKTEVAELTTESSGLAFQLENVKANADRRVSEIEQVLQQERLQSTPKGNHRGKTTEKLQ